MTGVVGDRRLVLLVLRERSRRASVAHEDIGVERPRSASPRPHDTGHNDRYDEQLAHRRSSSWVGPRRGTYAFVDATPMKPARESLLRSADVPRVGALMNGLDEPP